CKMDVGRPAREFRDLDPWQAGGPRSSRHPGRHQRRVNEVYTRLRQAGGTIIEQGQTTCCYATSEKSWIDDPAGVSWETFFTTGESTDYGVSVENDPRVAHGAHVRQFAVAATSACCNT